MGALITPMMALVIPVDQVIGLLLPIFMLGDVFALAAHWRRCISRSTLGCYHRVVWRAFTRGSFVLHEYFSRITSAFAWTFRLCLLVRLLECRISCKRSMYRAQNWHGMGCGGMAGFTSTLAHAMAITHRHLFADAEYPSGAFVVTSVSFFAVIHWIKVPYYYQAGLFDFPALVRAGLLRLVRRSHWSLGWKRAGSRVDRSIDERIILGLLVISGVLLPHTLNRFVQLILVEATTGGFHISGWRTSGRLAGCISQLLPPRTIDLCKENHRLFEMSHGFFFQTGRVVQVSQVVVQCSFSVAVAEIGA